MASHQPVFFPFTEADDDGRLLDNTYSDGWMASYRNRRRRCRPELKRVKEHCDRWMEDWEAGRTPKLPQDEREPEPSNGMMGGHDGQEAEDGGGWTVVSRGGKHGRSATTTATTTTISSQPQQKARGADPYAQSSMADRDASAAVKVMKRKFAKTQAINNLKSNDEEPSQNSFYSTKPADTRKRKKLF
ncbi:hypothetical protein PGT21_037306 [Puccinia graminis f. sp. tritici]|uniref:Uncharacterized protein n=1 Tax=Puccinia graminis f. sp. tritici TaxID=56615 RepID=A0A5B0R5K3_PUCGR|nr:hypothetical protein PGT21_037306 [Puccinia graminis f. sp. tritici]